MQTYNDVLPWPGCAVSKDLPGGKLMDASAHLCHNPAATTNPQPLLWAGPASWFSSSLSLSPPIPCSTLICLSSSGSSGKSSRQARKVKWRDTACFFSAVSNLSLVRSWPIWNARRMWTKTEMYWRAAGFKSVSMIREHTFIGAVLGLSDIRLTFKLGTGSVITLIAPGTSECSTGQIKNDVCSSR